MKYNYSDIELKEIREPVKDCSLVHVDLSDETIEKRKQTVLDKMAAKGLDVLIVYGDLEHSGNFEYLVGFPTRFEESLLVLHKDGSACLVLGNENENKASKSRIEAKGILASYFSLPNQPMKNPEPFIEILRKTGIEGKKVGVAGWKLFTSRFEDNKKMFEIPYYTLKAILDICGEENVENATDIFFGRDGARNINNANEIAHYEFGAALASDAMLDAMNALKPGLSEFEAGHLLQPYGQRGNVVTIAAFGERFINANIFPTERKLEPGCPVALTIGLKGGSASRSGIAVSDVGELPENQQNYVEKVVAPYFTAIRRWLENIKVGMTGGELYSLIDEVLPRETYKWYLCPGHLTSDEEWSCSPIYEGSEDPIRSGMLLQTDILPSISGYPGVNVESPVCVADEKLRNEIREQYPEMYDRMMARREYIINEIGINLSEDVLPTGSTVAYMRPLMLSRKAAVVKK